MATSSFYWEGGGRESSADSWSLVSFPNVFPLLSVIALHSCLGFVMSTLLRHLQDNLVALEEVELKGMKIVFENFGGLVILLLLSLISSLTEVWMIPPTRIISIRMRIIVRRPRLGSIGSRIKKNTGGRKCPIIESLQLQLLGKYIVGASPYHVLVSFPSFIKRFSIPLLKRLDVMPKFCKLLRGKEFG
ncbi:hypothetical protein PIB30_067200 [Stylosanthes scabra]|uniref:Uncharacterized protein n=1 Tax=Stylosanthes scabra TaxID=79078 RepID=A0ABU6TN92_9FABA|nr:hypothetical protein [Stylosanthes scabra]